MLIFSEIKTYKQLLSSYSLATDKTNMINFFNFAINNSFYDYSLVFTNIIDGIPYSVSQKVDHITFLDPNNCSNGMNS